MKFNRPNKQTPYHGGDGKFDSYMQYRNRSIIVCIVVLAVFFFFYRHRSNELIYVLPEEDAISITSNTGEKISVNYKSLISVELTDSIDFGEVLDGTDTARVASGLWKNDIWEDYHLFILPKIKKYIILTTQEDVVVFNYESASVTEDVYHAFYDLMSQKGIAEQIQFLP